jgi:ectoine hydroxylase-related dioxygenase (phytanoyl-CoA dioxygenase family)
MTASLEHLNASTDSSADITAKLLEDGGVVVEGLLEPGLLARFNAELDPFVEAVSPEREFLNPAIDFFFGSETRHVTAVAAKSRIFATEILTHPLYREICDTILLPSCSRYQINIAQVLDRGPGAGDQLLHRDQDVWVHLPKPHPEIQVASVIALVDFTAEIGATRVVPGSHRWEPGRSAEPGEIAVAEMPAGAAVLYLGSTIHAGGPNSSADRWRRGMHLSYTVGWLRTEENQYLSVPPEIVRDLPRESQELLGYAAHDAIQDGGGYLGTVDIMDPVELLQRGAL